MLTVARQADMIIDLNIVFNKYFRFSFSLAKLSEKDTGQ